MHNFFDFIALIKKNVENIFVTALRKQKIRRAYRGKFYIHPFFIILFFALAALVAFFMYIPPKIAAFVHFGNLNEPVVLGDTAFPVIEQLQEAASVSEGFLEPFAIVEGMESMEWMIVVDKFHRILYLLRQGDSRWGVVRIYPVAVGENEGAKEREGDRRTPQGLYFMVRKRHHDELVRSYGRAVAAQFGPHAFVLNYPNRHDIAARRTGSGIWIHGTFENTVPVVSRGCVSMHNTYVEDLFRFIGDGLLTPVILIEERYTDFRNLINLDEIWRERLLVADEFGIDPFTNLGGGRQDVPVLPFPGVEVQPITLTPQEMPVQTHHEQDEPISLAVPQEEEEPVRRERRQLPIIDMLAQRQQRTPPVRPTRTALQQERENAETAPAPTRGQDTITQLAAQQNAQTQAQAVQTPPAQTAAQQQSPVAQNAAPQVRPMPASVQTAQTPQAPAVAQTPQTPQTPAVVQTAPSAQETAALRPAAQTSASEQTASALNRSAATHQTAAGQRSERAIAQFMDDWARAWESRNLERYSRFYDPSVFPDWRAFIEQKRGIFVSVNSISVTLSDINVISITQDGASVRFSQLYETERARFFSRKQLDLAWRNGAWVIVNEFVVR